MSIRATVHVIDDDEATRKALARLLAASGYEVRTYAAAGDYLVPSPEHGPSCLVLDLQLQGASGLELQQALLRHPAYKRPIVFLSGTADVRSSVRAMQGGACDFLTKPVDADRLLAAVTDAIAVDTESSEERLRADTARGRIESLDERERRVLEGILAGRLHKQLADDFGVSERTIKHDRARVMKRIGVRTLPALFQVLIDAQRSS